MAHLDTATAGPRTVPVRSGFSGVKTLEFSGPPRPSDVLRAGTARAPVVVSICDQSAHALAFRLAEKNLFHAGWITDEPVHATQFHQTRGRHHGDTWVRHRLSAS